MHTMTDLSAFNLEIREQESIELATQQEEWSGRLLKIEKWTNRFCLTIVALSALYFTPVVISIIYR